MHGLVRINKHADSLISELPGLELSEVTGQRPGGS